MLVPGHLATAALLAAGVARGATQKVGLWPAVVVAGFGGLTPDLIDKSRMALGWTPFGRTIGHSLVFMIAIVGVWLLAQRRAERWGAFVGFWVLGVFSHLLADLADDAVLGWLSGRMVASSWWAWPFAEPYDWRAVADGPLWASWALPFTPLEVIVVGATGVAALRLTRRSEGRTRP
ncbi:MAG: metal-dependent hydrolase [Gemmatimonadetes bacterium]|nr:metal-dependent hydrolase [Gemmatimonadota bacterium]